MQVTALSLAQRAVRGDSESKGSEKSCCSLHHQIGGEGRGGGEFIQEHPPPSGGTIQLKCVLPSTGRKHVWVSGSDCEGVYDTNNMLELMINKTLAERVRRG